MSNLPTVSIITPSFNQGKYLEETILSVLNQDYPNIEYIIIDGGSADNSVDIIKKYEERLAYWISEPDNGQTDAIIKGFNKAKGSFLTWLNSDDLFEPSMIKISLHFLQEYPEVGLTFGDRMRIDSKGNIYSFQRYPQFRKLYLKWGLTLPQETVLFRREEYENSGGLTSTLHMAMDYDLWCKLIEITKFYHIPAFLGRFRAHASNKSTAFTNQMQNATFQDRYTSEFSMVMQDHFGKKPSARRMRLGSCIRNFNAILERRTKRYKGDFKEASKIRLQ